MITLFRKKAAAPKPVPRRFVFKGGAALELRILYDRYNKAPAGADTEARWRLWTRIHELTRNYRDAEWPAALSLQCATEFWVTEDLAGVDTKIATANTRAIVIGADGDTAYNHGVGE